VKECVLSNICKTLSLVEEGSFYVWSGNDEETVPMMSIGARGVISVLANICPVETGKMCRLALQGDFVQAGKMQVAFTKLIDALFCEVNPIPIKTAMNMLGFDVGDLRLPLYDMSPANLQFLTDTLKEYKLLK